MTTVDLPQQQLGTGLIDVRVVAWHAAVGLESVDSTDAGVAPQQTKPPRHLSRASVTWQHAETAEAIVDLVVVAAVVKEGLVCFGVAAFLGAVEVPNAFRVRGVTKLLAGPSFRVASAGE